MENEQQAKLDSFQRVQACNEEYATDLATIPDYDTFQNAFDNNVAQIIAAAEAQQVTEGATPDLMDGLKRDMAETTIEFASRGSVKAHLIGNHELGNQLDHAVSYILYAEKQTAVQRAQDLRNLMNANLATLTNITAGNITTIGNAITAYSDKMNDPIIHIEHKKSQGTELVDKFIKAANEELDKMFKLCKSYFFRTKPNMVSEMALAMQVINTGIRHTIVNILVVDESNAVIEGATVTDVKTGKSYIANYLGVAHIEQHRSGHDTFNISKPGKHSVTVGMDIKRGTENNLTVHLVAV